MTGLSHDEIVALCQALDTARTSDQNAAWEQLQPLGKGVVPYLAEAYHKLRKWQGRLACVYHLMAYGRSHEEAFQVGIAALADKATLVRYRACMLLAYAQREDAIPHLEGLLDHADEKTVEDARAAIDAIRAGNHKLFLDRHRTGRVFWSVARPGSPLPDA
ncbi:MAG: hypothetical protein ACE5R4_00400 [Armatimonadota bacterium]